MLGSLGYRVLVADTVESSIALAGTHQGRIDLLLTDVIMPKMNGRELYDALQSGRSDLKVLFMSGYSGTVIAHHGVLDEGMQFIQKPFTASALSAKIRLVLDSAS
jgi:two-component system cell cycle sensor histidine kinase/response regulator CckA